MVDRPEQSRLWRRAAYLTIAVMAVLAACGSESGSQSGTGASSAASNETTVSTTSSSSTSSATTTVAPTTAPSTTPPTTAATPRPRGHFVTRVIDGDTVELADGSRVRLAGIDTPERGQCGYSEAANALNSMVMDREVALVAGSRDDTDRYGRLIRYIEVDGIDVNLAMINSGWAIARYDSRDGYGRHEREDAYIAADVGTPVRPECAGSSAPARNQAPTTLVGGSGATDPRFGSCKAAKADGRGPYVRGIHPEYDWYRDADNDGTVCE